MLDETLIEMLATIRQDQLKILASQERTESIVTQTCEAITAQIPMFNMMLGDGGLGKLFGL